MRNLLLLLFLLPLVATAEKTVPTTINDVTVFLRGAEIHRSGMVTVTQGRNALVFNGLTESIDPASIQVKSSGEVTILQVTHSINYLHKQRKGVRLMQLEDSLNMINERLAYNTNMTQVYVQERDMILANKTVKGENTVLNIEDIEDVADFYRTRLEDIFSREMALKAKRTELTEIRNRLQQQLNSLKAKMNRPTSQILVEINAEHATRSQIDLTYMTYAASWRPTYDLRADDTNEPVLLNYRAFVQQNTGVDWEKVSLVLSTGNPSQNNTQPSPRPWELDFAQPTLFRSMDAYKSENMMLNSAMPRAAAEDAAADPSMMELDGETAAAYTQVVSTDVNVEFRIKIPYDIPSDGQDHQVHIQDHALPATYQHFVAPKYDLDAFLLARVTGWDNLNLLDGPANIFFQGTYVGKTFINTHQTSDTLELSMGRDKGIVVTRKRMKDFTEKKSLGSTVRETMGLEISIRNQKAIAVNLKVTDQIPVSNNKDIEVELIESSKAKHDKDKGFLHWQTTIEPSGTRKLVFVYSVKYPKDQRVDL